MKITLPENLSEIKLGQFQEYEEFCKDLTGYSLQRLTVSIFTNTPVDMVDKFPNKDIEESYWQIMKSLETQCDFEKFVTIDGVEYGFHPNLDISKGAEMRDFYDYANDPKQTHRLMAILFRPVTKKDKFGNYDIEEYNGTEKWAEKMKEMPLNIVNGALVFFLNLSKELESYIQKFINKGQVKDKKLLTTLKSGVGMLPSSILQTQQKMVSAT